MPLQSGRAAAIAVVEEGEPRGGRNVTYHLIKEWMS